MEKVVAGVDEAGRGPLAGPVFAAAVILNPHYCIEGLADSKTLSEKRREALFKAIKQHALAWAIGYSEPKEIDEINILQATFKAMQRAVAKLKLKPELILVDGNQSPVFPYASKFIIRGDASQPAISAASIVAKVMRDRLMKKMDKLYPQYGFLQNKGYPTPKHLWALKKHGPSKIHRFTFSPVSIAHHEKNEKENWVCPA